MCHIYCMLHMHLFCSVNNIDVGIQQVVKTWPVHSVAKYSSNFTLLTPCIFVILN
jgi:hypothetical protein